MDIFGQFIRDRGFQIIGRWCLLPVAIVGALFLPPLLFSFIPVLALTVAVTYLYAYSNALPELAPADCRTGIEPRSPPID